MPPLPASVSAAVIRGTFPGPCLSLRQGRENPRIRVLKTETGVDREAIETLREELRAAEREGKSPPAA
ncbi:MAG: hypothetical protein OHK0028_17920 [Deltaproteobacteria bacterium]